MDPILALLPPVNQSQTVPNLARPSSFFSTARSARAAPRCCRTTATRRCSGVSSALMSTLSAPTRPHGPRRAGRWRRTRHGGRDIVTDSLPRAAPLRCVTSCYTVSSCCIVTSLHRYAVLHRATLCHRATSSHHYIVLHRSSVTSCCTVDCDTVTGGDARHRRPRQPPGARRLRGGMPRGGEGVERSARLAAAHRAFSDCQRVRYLPGSSARRISGGRTRLHPGVDAGDAL